MLPSRGQKCSCCGPQHFGFFAGEGESQLWLAASAFKSFMLKLVMAAPIFLNTFVHDSRYFKNRPQGPGYIKIRKEKEIVRTMCKRSSFESVRLLIKFVNSCSLVVVLFVRNHFKVNSNIEPVLCGASKEYKTI